MSKLLIRIVAFLLVPCLIAEPAASASLLHPLFSARGGVKETINPLFSQEAFAEPSTQFIRMIRNPTPKILATPVHSSADPDHVELVRAILSDDPEISEDAEASLDGVLGHYENTEARQMLAGWLSELVTSPLRVAQTLERGQGLVLKLPLSFSQLIKIIDSTKERSLSIHRTERESYLVVTPGTELRTIPSSDRQQEVAFALPTTIALLAPVQGHSHPRYMTANPSGSTDIVGASDDQSSFIVCLKSPNTIEVTFRRAHESQYQTSDGDEALRILTEIGLLKPQAKPMHSSTLLSLTVIPVFHLTGKFQVLGIELLVVLLAYLCARYFGRFILTGILWSLWCAVFAFDFLTHLSSYFKIKPWRDFEPIARSLVEQEEAIERGEPMSPAIKGPAQDIQEANWAWDYDNLKAPHQWLRERDSTMDLSTLYDFLVRLRAYDDPYLRAFGYHRGTHQRTWARILAGFAGYGGALIDNYLQLVLDADRLWDGKKIRLTSGVQANVRADEDRNRLILKAAIPPHKSAESIFPTTLTIQRGGIRGTHQYVVHGTNEWGLWEIKSVDRQFQAIYLPNSVFVRRLIEPLVSFVDPQIQPKIDSNLKLLKIWMSEFLNRFKRQKIDAPLKSWIDKLEQRYKPHGLECLENVIYFAIDHSLTVSTPNMIAGIPLERVISQFRFDKSEGRSAAVPRVRRVNFPMFWQGNSMGELEAKPNVIASRIKSSGNDYAELYAWVRLLEALQIRTRQYQRRLPKYSWSA